MFDPTLITFALTSLVAIILIATGIRNRASLGVVLAVVLVVIATRRGETSLAQMGLVAPESWLSTVLLGLLIGSGLSMLSIMLIEPLIENITKQPHDWSLVEGVRGNWKSLLVWLVVVWTLVAFGEEYLYRGFLMSQLVKLLGESVVALVLNLLVSSIVFGISHSYQGRSGIWSTGFIGICLGLVYILSGFNLWLPILVHGAGNTVAFVLMFCGADKRLRELMWEKALRPVG